MTDNAKPSGFRNLFTRAATGIVLVAIALAALYAGTSAFWLLAALLALAMISEWSALMGVERWRMAVALLAMAALLAFVQPLVRPIDLYSVAAVGIGATAVSVIALSLRLGSGFAYIGLAIVAVLFLREDLGIALALWTLSVVWATDVGAYFSGKTVGGPKLAPALSPNKTWAGLIGGMATAALVSAAIVMQADLPRWLIPFAPALAIVAQAGDLYESWLKRRAGVKDASTLFPGHGGALDRLDGLLPVAIVVGAIAATGGLR